MIGILTGCQKKTLPFSLIYTDISAKKSHLKIDENWKDDTRVDMNNQSEIDGIDGAKSEAFAAIVTWTLGVEKRQSAEARVGPVNSQVLDRGHHRIGKQHGRNDRRLDQDMQLVILSEIMIFFRKRVDKLKFEQVSASIGNFREKREACSKLPIEIFH